MKKILFYIITLSLGLASCNDILEKEDPTAINPTETWNDNILATAYLDRCYLDVMPVWDESPATLCDESQGGGSFLYGELVEGSESYWPYDKIYRLNILLDNIDNGILTDAQKKVTKGQALFLRSYLYFELVKRYGGVPLILEPQDRYNDDLEIPRSKTSECIKQIVTDLDSAASYLPGTWGGIDVGRIFKGAAMAFKGRVLMFYASKQFNRTNDITRWQTAYDANLAAKSELDKNGYTLNASFREIWSKVTKESIIMTRFKNPGRTHNFENGMRPLEYAKNASGYNQPSLDMALAFPMSDGTAPGVMKSGVKVPFNVTKNDTTGLFWINRDPRFVETIVYNGAIHPIGGLIWPENRMFTYKSSEVSVDGGTKTGFYIRKFVQDGKTAADCYEGTLAWIEMRYAEVVLNLAECAAELGGKDAEVYDILKNIRKRAGITANADNLYGLKANMTQPELIDAVIFEKRIELAFENKRFWDMRRRMIFSDPAYVGYSRRRIEISRTKAYEKTTRDVLIPIVANAKTINSSEYFKYFTTKILPIDDKKTWNVPEKYYFYTLDNKHYEVNKNLQATAGWTDWGNGLFDPLE